MANNLYTTKTAALKATKADINKLDAKKMLLNGKNILEYIKDNSTIILDERGTKADDELDIWNSYVTKDENGNVIVNKNAKPKEHTYEEMTDEQKELLLNSAAQVIDNEVLDTDGNHLMYWQTDGLTNAMYKVDEDNDDNPDLILSVFCHYEYANDQLSNLNLTTFSSDLHSLTNGHRMFQGCSQLTTFSSDLSILTDGYAMFNGCVTLTSFDSDLSSLTDGREMFCYCENLTSFSSNLRSLTDGTGMFATCNNLTSFSSDLSSLTTAERMFESCSNLTSFTSNLSSLTDGGFMFDYSGIESFSSDLSSLTNGTGMFDECSSLTSFTSDLSSLECGDWMFYNTNLESFSSDLSNLTTADSMFWGCFNLTTFNSNLSSLMYGCSMFEGCRLDAPSVANIIHFLPQRDDKPTDDYENGNIQIGIDITNTDEAKQAFAEACDCSDWDELNKEFDDKNWVVHWQFNGFTSYSLRSPRPSTAVYAKLEEVIEPSDKKARKPHYQYTSQDGSKFYNIHWYHDSNTNNEGVDYFESLEEAISAYGVIPKA